MLAARKQVFLLDVRQPKELEEEGAIKGAINIPLGTLADRLSRVPKGRPVVSICRSAVRAAPEPRPATALMAVSAASTSMTVSVESPAAAVRNASAS